MKRTWTIIGVANVSLSLKWYQSLFGQRETTPAHDYWAQVLDADGTVLLCLHQWGAHDHPTLSSPDRHWAVDVIGNNLTDATILVATPQIDVAEKEKPLNVVGQLRYQW